MHPKGKCPLRCIFCCIAVEYNSDKENIPRHPEHANKRHKLCVITALVDGHLVGRFGTAPYAKRNVCH